MSKKNLARTVIEGGRTRYSQWDRHYSHTQARQREHLSSSLLLRSIDPDDVAYPELRVVYRSFHDKLRPAERWLDKQVGRPWNNVRSELFERFDARTTAGRHILFCHLLQSVKTSSTVVHFEPWTEFRVDTYGILRRAPPRPRWRTPLAPELPERQELLEAWIGSRRVGERSPQLYWFVKTPAGSFRQHQRLTNGEAARWRTLPEWFRALNKVGEGARFDQR
jgi:hypothetical protein